MDKMTWARERIAAQRGRLRGWRPIVNGDVAVVALEVLGVAQGDADMLGLQVIVAGRTQQAIDTLGTAEAERMLRARSVLGPEDPFAVVRRGEVRTGDANGENPAHWPWIGLVVHVPVRRLPEIAGLASDAVPWRE